MRHFAIYEHDKTSFTNGELDLLTDVISASVSQTVEGEFTASLTIPYTEKNCDLIQNGRLICLPIHPTDVTWQPFRITSYSEKFDSNDRTIDISLDHWSYDLNYYPSVPFSEVIGAKNAVAAIIDSQPLRSHPFEITTTLNDTTTKFASTNVTSVRGVIGDGESSFMNVFKCECYFDRTTVRLTSKIGTDRDIVLSLYGNLTGSTEEYVYDDFRTGVFPYWKDSETSTWIYQSSGIERIIPTGAPSGSHTKIATVDLSDQFETKPTQQQLHDKALEYITKNDLAHAKVTIDLNGFVPGSNNKTADDELFAPWRNVPIFMGDTFVYKNSVTKKETRVRLVGSEYDCLEDAYTSMTVDTNYAKASETISGLGSVINGLSSSVVSNKNWTSIAMSTPGGADSKGQLEAGSVLQVNSYLGFGRLQCKYKLTSTIQANYGVTRLLLFDANYAPDFPVPIHMWVANGLSDTNIGNGNGRSSIEYNHITGIVCKTASGSKGTVCIYNMSSQNVPSNSTIYFSGTWIYNSK